MSRLVFSVLVTYMAQLNTFLPSSYLELVGCIGSLTLWENPFCCFETVKLSVKSGD